MADASIAYLAMHQTQLELALSDAVCQTIRARKSDPIRHVGKLLVGLQPAGGEERAACVVLAGAAADAAEAALAAAAAVTAAAGEHEGTGDAAAISALRRAVCTLSLAQATADAALQRLVDAGAPTSRAGYLRSLPELLPPPLSASVWREEWPSLFAENLHLTGGDVSGGEIHDEAWAREHEPLPKWLAKLEGDIEAMMALGAPRDEAEAFVLLNSKRFALAGRLRAREPTFAASTYALVDAIVAQALRQGAGVAVPLYYNLRGLNSLVRGDPAWEAVLTPDSTGFQGVRIPHCKERLCS